MQILPLNSSVNFTSSIEVINDYQKFEQITKNCLDLVDEPWTYKDIIKSSQGKTKNISSCTAGGIITRNSKDISARDNVILFHINAENKENSDFEEIKKAIIDKIGDDEVVEGFLLGGKKPITSEQYEEVINRSHVEKDEQALNKILSHSMDMFDNFEKLMQSLKIQYSKFKGLPLFGKANLFYSSASDKWVVYARDFNDYECNIRKSLKNYFDDVFVCEKDNVVEV